MNVDSNELKIANVLIVTAKRNVNAILATKDVTVKPVFFIFIKLKLTVEQSSLFLSWI